MNQIRRKITDVKNILVKINHHSFSSIFIKIYHKICAVQFNAYIIRIVFDSLI